jgi:hypothetical protein
MPPKTKTEATGLDLLREPFPATQINQLPKITCKDCSKYQCTKHEKKRCNKCAAWITTAHVDLDFVGHAALTDRLLDADLAWTWEPLAFDEKGLPAYDSVGGMWIRLTICGVTRLGYGHAGTKSGGDAVKEIIGDALRNAAMRFGAALDLWHKGDLHADEDTLAHAEHKQLVNKTLADEHKADRGVPAEDPWAKPIETDTAWLADWLDRLNRCDSLGALRGLYDEALMQKRDLKVSEEDFSTCVALKDNKKTALESAPAEAGAA